MEKLLLIIKREFIAKVRNKSFIIITILSPIVMVALVAFIIFIQTKSQNEFKNVAYIDNSSYFEEIFTDSEHIHYINLNDLSADEAKEESKAKKHYGLVYIPKTKDLEALEKGISFYSETTPGLSFISTLESKIEKKIQILKFKKLNIDLEKIEKAETRVDILTSKFSGEKSSKMGNALRIALGGIMGYLLFMFIVIYGNSVMRSVIEEKTNRIIEVIISSVKPFYLMLGKIFGNALAGLLQFFIWMITAAILMSVLSSVFGVDTSMAETGNIPSNVTDQFSNSTNTISMLIQEVKSLPLVTMFFAFVFYFLGGYLVYSSIYAAIGAAVDSETDTQQFMIPVLMPLMIAIYAGMTIIESPHSSIAVGFSLFPLTSPIVMLMRIPFGVPTWQIIVSMVLLIITFIGIVTLAAKIYRIGILMYGKKPTYKDLYKWLRM